MNRDNNFSVFTHWVSHLGNSKKKSYLLFNLVVILYSIFNFVFTNSIRSITLNTFPVRVSSILFYITSLLVILLLFFPLDKNFKVHRNLSDLMFTSIFLALTLLLYSFFTSPNIPPVLLLSLSITVLISFLFLISFALLRYKYGMIPETLIEIRKSEKSLLIRNAFFFEWVFIGTLSFFQLIVLVYTF